MTQKAMIAASGRSSSPRPDDALASHRAELEAPCTCLEGRRSRTQSSGISTKRQVCTAPRSYAIGVERVRFARRDPHRSPMTPHRRPHGQPEDLEQRRAMRVYRAAAGRSCARSSAHCATTVAVVGLAGLEPATKGFTSPRRFRREWTISSPATSRRASRCGVRDALACHQGHCSPQVVSAPSGGVPPAWLRVAIGRATGRVP